ncbi:hypothetical protein H8526_005575, partial [Salmonella enterica]|nr:hypothetical protein [Salmonella enterica]
MAVENKFKLNIIAASVLMGLSLSVVASAQAAGSVSAAETTPVKPEVKTLAGLTAPLSDEDYSKINVGGSTLADALNETKNGSVAELKGKYQEAQKAYSKLSETQKGIISKLNTTTADKEAATQKWNDFGNQLKAADDVYTSNLNSLYGANHNAFTIGAGGVIAPDTNRGSTYDKFLTAYQDLAGGSGKVKKLNDEIITLLKDGSHGGKSDVNMVNEAKIVAYSNYLQKYADLQTAKLKADSVRNIVIQNIADILNKADSSANEDGVSGALKKVKTNFDTWNKSKNAANEKMLAESVKALVGIDSGNFTQTEKDAAAAWSTAADDVSTKESDLTGAGKAAKMNEAIRLVPVLAGQNILTSEDEPKDFNDALNKLKAAYTALLRDGAFQDDADPAKGHALSGLIADVQGAQSTLDGLKTEYQAKVKNIKEAGAARLDLLLNALPDQQKDFLKAQNDYQNALAKYKADNAAKDALEGLYGADGESGALGDYLTKLKATSDGIQKALAKAGRDYAGVVSGEGKTQQEKNKALYDLISTQKTLVPVKLQMDTEHLNLLQTAPADAINGLTALKNDLSTAAANKAKAKADYIGAVEGYLAADKAYQTSKSETDAAKLATAQAKLMTVVGISDPNGISKLYVDNEPGKGFKQFDELTATESDVIGKYNAAVAALAKTENGGSDIQKARAEVVKSMKTIAGLMPLSSTEEQ